MEVLNKFLGKVVVEIVNPLILLLAGAAFVLFVWGVFQFIAHAGDETKRSEGRQAILWGLIGIVIIFGAYGIINIALGAFNLNPIGPIAK
jgi:type VI protein secretion system component VasK